MGEAFMKHLRTPVLIAVLAASTTADAALQAATATINDRDGRNVGNAVLRETPNGVLLHVRLAGIAPGEHAFHIHERGTCEPPFTSAGGHFAPEGAEHGLLDPSGPHSGDMPNIHIPTSSRLELEVMTGIPALSDQLFDLDGAAIVIHEGPDDYSTNPAGAAGERIACGVIEEAEVQESASTARR